MNQAERIELSKLRESIQELALEVARLGQAITPLQEIPAEQSSLRDRVASLEGFKMAVMWIAGLLGSGAIIRLVYAAVAGR